MVFGLSLPFFGHGLIGGLWLASLAWFLNNAAVQSYKQVAIQDVLDGAAVARMLRTDPPTVPDTLSVADLVCTSILATDSRAYPSCTAISWSGWSAWKTCARCLRPREP